MKYTKVRNVCKIFKTIAIGRNDGQLLIENERTM